LLPGARSVAGDDRGDAVSAICEHGFMPRSMWKGAVSFGMVAIPVRLYLATESKSVSFRSLCPCHKQPIKQKRHCAVDDKVIEYKDVLRGFELERDQYVV